MVFNLFIEKFRQVEKPTLFVTNDDLYSFAHASFLNIAKDIESIVAPNEDDYWDGEEWYDEYEDEVIQEFMRLWSEVYTTAEMVDWNAYKKSVEEAIANEKLWGLGGSPHAEENIEMLQEELELIENKEYAELLEKYDKCVWKDFLI